MDRLTCPLIEFGCRRERCAWWDVQARECAILTAVRTMKDIKSALTKSSAKAKDDK
jgi:hypothetical protein